MLDSVSKSLGASLATSSESFDVRGSVSDTFSVDPNVTMQRCLGLGDVEQHVFVFKLSHKS